MTQDRRHKVAAPQCPHCGAVPPISENSQNARDTGKRGDQSRTGEPHGGAFTSDFARITPPQVHNLPYLKVIADTLNVKV